MTIYCNSDQHKSVFCIGSEPSAGAWLAIVPIKGAVIDSSRELRRVENKSCKPVAGLLLVAGGVRSTLGGRVGSRGGTFNWAEQHPATQSPALPSTELCQVVAPSVGQWTHWRHGAGVTGTNTAFYPAHH